MTRRIIIMLALGVALAVATLFGVTQCQSARTAKTTADLAKGQAGAAVQSGGDAVETLGNRMAADVAGQDTVKETEDAIANATDAAGVSDAGRSGLCGLRGYRNHPDCVQRAGPR